MQNEVQVSEKPFVRLATRQDALDLAPRIRKADLEEISHGTGLDPEVALRYALAISNIAYAVVWREKVIALFGIVGEVDWGEGPGKGLPWMLASDELTAIRKSFLRHCRKYVEGWLEVHGELEGYVWADNKVHIQWLQWLGFQFEGPVPYGVTDQPFLRFFMKTENV